LRGWRRPVWRLAAACAPEQKTDTRDNGEDNERRENGSACTRFSLALRDVHSRASCLRAGQPRSVRAARPPNPDLAWLFPTRRRQAQDAQDGLSAAKPVACSPRMTGFAPFNYPRNRFAGAGLSRELATRLPAYPYHLIRLEGLVRSVCLSPNDEAL
jgi:hypothetical protein